MIMSKRDSETLLHALMRQLERVLPGATIGLIVVAPPLEESALSKLLWVCNMRDGIAAEALRELAEQIDQDRRRGLH